MRIKIVSRRNEFYPRKDKILRKKLVKMYKVEVDEIMSRDCEHIAELEAFSSDDEFDVTGICDYCKSNENKTKWMCLHCQKRKCMFVVDEDHTHTPKHALYIQLSRNSTIWCSKCKKFIDHPFLYPYIEYVQAKFDKIGTLSFPEDSYLNFITESKN